jgi:hypothetical protein
MEGAGSVTRHGSSRALSRVAFSRTC